MFTKTTEPKIHIDTIWINKLKEEILKPFVEIELVVQLQSSNEIVKQLCEQHNVQYKVGTFSYGFHFKLTRAEQTNEQ